MYVFGSSSIDNTPTTFIFLAPKSSKYCSCPTSKVNSYSTSLGVKPKSDGLKVYTSENCTSEPAGADGHSGTTFPFTEKNNSVDSLKPL